MIGWVQRVRNTWGLFSSRRSARRAAAWRTLWQTDRAHALAVCDAIVRERDVPERLLRRLSATIRGESHPRNSGAKLKQEAPPSSTA